MTIIFDRLMNGCMRVYIHTFSAVDQVKLTKKLHTHSEYDTDWSNKISEWIDKLYFVNYVREDMFGHETCITVLTFIDISSTTDFIQKLNSYFYDNEDSSYAHIVQFQSISKTS